MRIAIAMMITLAAESFAQSSSQVSLSNGVQLTITSNAGSNSKIELAPASGNSFYRIFRDENDLAAFVYELMVEWMPDGEHFRVTAKPAGDDFARRFPNADAGKPAPTLAEPRESPLLASGDRFEVESRPIPACSTASLTPFRFASTNAALLLQRQLREHHPCFDFRVSRWKSMASLSHPQAQGRLSPGAT